MSKARPTLPPNMIFYIIAGEPSGDVLGAGLMQALRSMTSGEAQFYGIGGDRMAEQGLKSLFPISDLAVMGVFEILPRATLLLRRIKETVDDVINKAPSVLITIDSKAFTMRVTQRLFDRRKFEPKTFPLVHMVAPTVWAWRPGRAKVIARFLDHLLVLFPFEPPYFEKHGLSTTFIGHPAVDQPNGDGKSFRQKYGIKADAKVLSVLPGSRPGEVRRLLPIFGQTVDLLKSRFTDLHIVIPMVSNVTDQIKTMVSEWPGPIYLLSESERKFDAFAASDAALATSGTVTLELTISGVPVVVAYKVNPFTVPVGHLLVDRNSVVLTNRILQESLLPLFIQNQCKPEALAKEVLKFLDNSNVKKDMMVAAEKIKRILRPSEGQTSIVAARAVLESVQKFELEVC